MAACATNQLRERPADRDADTISDERDRCPDQPEDLDGFADRDGCPDPDNDADGVADVHDLCPAAPEDKDGFEDSDGCPDPDNDQDRIPDNKDRCPLQPETYNGQADDDGCPDQGGVKVDVDYIAIEDSICFARDSHALDAEANRRLDAVGRALTENAVEEIEVIGCSAWDEADRAALSHKRAEAVRAALIARGVKTELTLEDCASVKPRPSHKGRLNPFCVSFGRLAFKR